MKKIAFLSILILSLTCFSAAAAYAEEAEIGSDFLRIFDDHGAVMLLIDPQDGSILYANNAATRFYGYSKEQLESMKITDINTLNPDKAGKEMQAAASESRNYFIFRHRLANGETRLVDVYSYPTIYKDREVLFSIIYDITEKMELEEKEKTLTSVIFLGLVLLIAILLAATLLLIMNYRKVKKFNELRKIFIDSDDRLIYLKDENLRYVFVNRATEKFFGKDMSEIIGFDDYALSDKEFAEIRIKTDREVLERKTRIYSEVVWNNRTFIVNKFPVKLNNGRLGVGAYIEDITEALIRQKKEEKTMLRNSILVDVLSRDFKSSKEQLEYVLDKALQLTESKYGYIYLYDEEKQEFVLDTWSKNVTGDCAIAKKHMKYRLDETGLWGEAVRQRGPIVVNDFNIPNSMKTGYPEGHVRLLRFMTVPVIIENKILSVIGLANKESDYDDYQITVLMAGAWNARIREERRQALEKTNIELKEHKDRLQLILDSAAEAIYGIDSEGRCTFCNASCLEMLGYKEQSELIGKDMHTVTCHSSKDGTSLPVEQCKIYLTLKTGEGNHVDDEMFKRADGSGFYVEYFSYPQYKDGKLIGAVVTFMDITERKKAEDNIRYLSYHDALTGLYNRMFFEEELRRINDRHNLPISIIMCDVNGLKLTNDVFGHAYGDLLLKKAASTLRLHCRPVDIICRIGGDEFVVLLPKTHKEETEGIMNRIQDAFSKEKIAAIKGSISMGCETKFRWNRISCAFWRLRRIKCISKRHWSETALAWILSIRLWKRFTRKATRKKSTPKTSVNYVQ